jgi:hypothetical protein
MIVHGNLKRIIFPAEHVIAVLTITSAVTYQTEGNYNCMKRAAYLSPVDRTSG